MTPFMSLMLKFLKCTRPLHNDNIMLNFVHLLTKPIVMTILKNNFFTEMNIYRLECKMSREQHYNTKGKENA